MLGTNTCDVFDFDMNKMRIIGDRIGPQIHAITGK
jgi:hypothetical protein